MTVKKRDSVDKKFRPLWPSLLLFVSLLGFTINLWAKAPDELPGEEITEEQYLNFILPRDSIASQVPPGSPLSHTWLDSAAKTWEALPLSDQLANDKKEVLLGLGAVFVPSLSDPELEPGIDIFDSLGNAVAHGNTGEKFSLEPGNYSLHLGSGPRDQRIVKKVEVRENKITPVIPDWCGLSIDVVDKSGVSFAGQYELVNIKNYEAIGKGFGNDPELGKRANVWILREGTYKILSPGISYHALSGFVTVRLLPGEFTRFVLVQNSQDDMEIISGGALRAAERSTVSSNWKYGANIGGSVDFNSTENLTAKTTTTVTALTLLMNTYLNYKKNRFESILQLNADEGISWPGFDFSRLSNTTDDQRFSSIFIWHILEWLGPYARMESAMEMLSKQERAPETASRHYFMLLGQDSVLSRIDSVSSYIILKPFIFPVTLEAGAGASFNLIKTGFIQTGFRAGFGYKQEWHRGEAEKLDTSAVRLNEILFPQYRQIIARESYSVIRQFNDVTISELGPELSWDFMLRGKRLSVELKPKLFFPLSRIKYPDVNWWSTLSLYLVRPVTLDYQYQYILQRSEQESAQKQESKHRVLVRFSIVNR
jgi:hypothetical protein